MTDKAQFIALFTRVGIPFTLDDLDEGQTSIAVEQAGVDADMHADFHFNADESFNGFLLSDF